MRNTNGVTRIKFLPTIETRRLVVLLVRIVVYWRRLHIPSLVL
jgi:hypothetical protein